MIANVQFTASGNLLEREHINNANMGLNSELSCVQQGKLKARQETPNRVKNC